MASLNKVFLMGNLTRDPELRYTSGGAAICSFGLAVNRRFQTARGEEREEVCFVDIDVWGKQAESCNNYLRKGAPALVEGRLRYDSWDDRETGKKRSRLNIHAERVQFIGAPARGGNFGADAEDSGGPSRSPASGPSRQEGGSGEAPRMPPFEPTPDAEDDIPF